MQNQILLSRRWKRILLWMQILLIITAFAGGWVSRQWTVEQKEPFPVFQQVLTLLNQNGLKPAPQGKTLEYGMIRGMLQAYDDPFTIFVEPAQAELQLNQLQGKFGGIGVRLSQDADKNVVLYPIPDSPAARAGVRDNDRLMRVENLTLDAEADIEKVQAALRGPVDSKVTIQVGRAPDYQPIEYTIQRAEVAVPSVTYNLLADDARIGHIRVSLIAETSAEEVETAARALQKQGAQYFILDLRNNGGGLVEAGVDLARLFLSSGDVLQQQYVGKAIETYRVKRPGPLADLPLVVLINHNTASAAEITAGALAAQGRAPLIGQNSYGKRTIQLIMPLLDGSSVHITTARWWIPGSPAETADHQLIPRIDVPEGAAEIDFLRAAAKELIP